MVRPTQIAVVFTRTRIMTQPPFKPLPAHHQDRALRGRIRLSVEQLESRCVPTTDMVLQWNAVALDAVKNDYAIGHTPDQAGPTRAARALAIVHMAMYDAVEAVDGSYSPYLVDAKAPKGASMDAAIAQ